MFYTKRPALVSLEAGLRVCSGATGKMVRRALVTFATQKRGQGRTKENWNLTIGGFWYEFAGSVRTEIECMRSEGFDGTEDEM